MDVAVSNKVIARDNFGRFINKLEAAKVATMDDLANAGANLSRQFAPKGIKRDPRTPHIADSIIAESTPTTASWKVLARHGLPQETGSKEHEITGQVAFFWEREGRWFRPGPNMIHHPGNPAKPYLRPAYEIIMKTWMDFAKRRYA